MIDSSIPMAITTGKYGHFAKEAQDLADYYNLPFIERNNKGIDKLLQLHDLKALLVLTEDGLAAYSLGQKEKLRFHPGMAVPRMRLAKVGQQEPLLKAIEPQEGMRVLDCTLGLASDALTVALAIGEEGRVFGLEASPAIYIITDYGLRHYLTANKAIAQALKRITVQNENYNQFLPACREKFDVVYFDPMFDHGLYKSQSINALRPFADYSPLTPEIVRQALTLAPKAVVKYRQEAKLNLKFYEIIKGNYSPIAFGVCYRR